MKRLSIGNALLTLLPLASLLAGCDARREIFNDAGVQVQLEVSWQKARLRPEGVSIYVFAQETGKMVALLLTNEMRGDSVTLDSLKLHVGKYNVLVINETVASHDNASFRNYDSYGDFEAYLRTVQPAGGGQPVVPAVPYDPVAAQNVLAAAHQSVEVTYDMLSGKQEPPPVVRLEPRKRSFVVEVTLHVKNLRYLHDAEPVAAVTNMAEGARLVADSSNNGTPVTQRFTLHSRKLDPGSSTDGTLTGTFVYFGVVSAAGKNMLQMPFVLHDGENFYLDRDITDNIIDAMQESQNADGTLKIELGSGTPEDPPIVIDRVPVDDASGLFEVKVDEWGDNTDIYVPVG
jgi:hypothetical protein